MKAEGSKIQGHPIPLNSDDDIMITITTIIIIIRRRGGRQKKIQDIWEIPINSMASHCKCFLLKPGGEAEEGES